MFGAVWREVTKYSISKVVKGAEPKPLQAVLIPRVINLPVIANAMCCVSKQMLDVAPGCAELTEPFANTQQRFESISKIREFKLIRY